MQPFFYNLLTIQRIKQELYAYFVHFIAFPLHTVANVCYCVKVMFHNVTKNSK